MLRTSDAILLVMALLAVASTQELEGPEADALDDDDRNSTIIPKNSTWHEAESQAPHTAIINGELARPGEFPFLVSISLLRPGEANFHLCGGSLVTYQHVLTAAHCVVGTDKTKLVVIVGISNVLRRPAADKIMTIAQMFVHEAYNPRSIANDVALIKLSRSVASRLHKRVRPVQFPPSDNEVYPANMLLSTAGWGQTVGGDEDSSSARLQKTRMPVMDGKWCKDLFHDMYDSRTRVCVGNSQTSTCQGDSGGPLLKRSSINGRWMIVGLTSYGFVNCKAGTANVFTRVNQFLPWIKQHVR